MSLQKSYVLSISVYLCVVSMSITMTIYSTCICSTWKPTNGSSRRHTDEYLHPHVLSFGRLVRHSISSKSLHCSSVRVRVCTMHRFMYEIVSNFRIIWGMCCIWWNGGIPQLKRNKIHWRKNHALTAWWMSVGHFGIVPNTKEDTIVLLATKIFPWPNISSSHLDSLSLICNVDYMQFFWLRSIALNALPYYDYCHELNALHKPPEIAS